MTPLDLGLSVVAGGSVGLAFFGAHLAEKVGRLLERFRRHHEETILEYEDRMSRYKMERDTYRNLLDRRDQRRSNQPQPRDAAGRFTTRISS